MIVHYKNMISDEEIDRLYQLWFTKDDEKIKTKNLRYIVTAIEIQKHLEDLNLSYSFPIDYYRNLLLQVINEEYNKSYKKREFHNHPNEWSFVIYLNDNYDGGEIYFKNGTRIKPKKGDLVGFSGEEYHAIETPYNFTEQKFYYNDGEFLIDKRFTIVGFMNRNIFETTQKTII